jgi:hypothetical protein
MPPTRIAFLYNNRYTAAATVLTASSEVSALPVAASQNEDRSYVWQSVTGTGAATIAIDLGSVLPVSAIALANVKLIGAGVLNLYQCGDAGSPGGATLVATLPTQHARRRTTFAFFASQSHRHWQLEWTNPGGASDYAQLGFAFLGVEVEPTVNVRVPADVERVDPSVGTASVDGQLTYAQRTKYCYGVWEWDEVGEAQKEQLEDMFEAIGASGAHFVVLDTALAWTCWYARLAGELATPLAMLAGRYSPRIAWKENC